MPQAAVKELASRNQNGFEVTLLWDADSNEVSVKVVDQLDGSGSSLPIAGHMALDAFHHPDTYTQLNDDHGGRVTRTTVAQ